MSEFVIEDLPDEVHRVLKEHTDMAGLTVEAFARDALIARFTPGTDATSGRLSVKVSNLLHEDTGEA